MPSFIYESMRDYQRKGAHFLRKAGNALLADEPGLGKTIQTLGSILAVSVLDRDGQNEGPDYHLIVCPKVAVRNVWEPEIRRWYRDQRFEILTLVGKVADRQKRLRVFEPLEGTEHVFVIVNIESLRIKPEQTAERTSRPDTINWSVKTSEGKKWMWYAPENGILPEVFSVAWDTVVVDESHRALIRTKQGSAPMSQTRAGLSLIRADRRVALSGTPMRGKPEQLWGTLDWLGKVPSYWTWVKEYFRLSSNGFSNYVIDTDEPFRPDGEERLAKDLQRVMLRRTKGEVLPDLPPKTYAGAHLDPHDDRSPLGIWLEMSPVQKHLYDQLESEGMLIGKDRSEVPVEGTLALYTRQRQIATAEHEVSEGMLITMGTGPKTDWLLDWLDDNEGEQIVVVSQFTSVLDALYRGLAKEGYTVGMITGKVSERNRTAAIEGFQNGSIQIMLLNTKAGGVALTLDSADYLVFLDETSIPDDQIQAEDRIHRASRMHNVTIYYLRTLGTIEEEVAWVAAARQDVQQYLLDGARGVEAAKRIFYTTTQKEAS